MHMLTNHGPSKSWGFFLSQVPRPFLWLHGWLQRLPCVNDIVDHEVSPPATPSSSAKSTIKMALIFSDFFFGKKQ